MLVKYLPQLSQCRIVLASASPRRRELLTGLRLAAETVPSTFDETLDKAAFATPGDYAAETATHKAIEVSRTALLDSKGRRADLVIGADTVVELDGQILEKPADEQDAFRMLTMLSGRRHVVYTGVALVLPGATDRGVGRPPLMTTFYEKTSVEFAELDEATIWAYIESKEPMDKAGAYGIQGLGGSFVKSLSGCYFNVMGFPCHRFCVEVAELIGKGLLAPPTTF
eukprot:SM000147S01121  [mRNA]  locus=s147:239148:241620:+ [translate_table: standard]